MTENSLEKERMLLAAFERGDIESGKRIIAELIAKIHAANPFNFDIVRSRAIQLIVLMSRAAVNGDSDALLEDNNKSFKKIQESENVNDLLKNLHLAAESMAGNIFSFHGKSHASVLRKAQQYIWENYSRKLSLEEISRAAGLSAPYFSSIFKEEMGENLSSYLNRLRVERAVTFLTETVKPLKTVSKLCGFEDQSWFSKIFKNITGVSPGSYRKNGTLRRSGERRIIDSRLPSAKIGVHDEIQLGA
jgi:YesN/AraC family two-component response regulator